MFQHPCVTFVTRRAWMLVSAVLAAALLIQVLLDSDAKAAPPGSSSSAPDDGAVVALVVVGDWGREGNEPQSACATAMAATAATLQKELGWYPPGAAGGASGDSANYLGIISTGDNIYPDGLASAADVDTFRRSYVDVYGAPSLADLTWHAVMGNHDYHRDALAQLSREMAEAGLKWDAMLGGYREFGGAGAGAAPVLGVCFVDTNPWLDHYRSAPAGKYNLSWIVSGDVADAASWVAWEAAELASLERCLSASKATWRIVVGHHAVISYSAHHGSQPELAGIRQVIERMGAAAYFNGHDHNLQHAVPPVRAAVPGAAEPTAVHYVTSGAGSNMRDDVDVTKKDAATPGDGLGPLRFEHGTTPGYVVLRADRASLRITHHAAPSGAVMHTETIAAAK